MYIPRFRRIEQVIKEISEVDADTELNWRMIKSLIKLGAISQMKIGNAWLINIDELYSIFWEIKNEHNNDR